MRTNILAACGPLLLLGIALPLLSHAPPAGVTCQLSLSAYKADRCGDQADPLRVPTPAPSPRSPLERQELEAIDTHLEQLLDHPSVSDPLLLTTMQLEEAVAEVTSLPPAAREDASAAAVELVNEDPVNRAGAMLGALVAEVIGAHHRAGPGVGPFAIESAAWARLETLADGTAAHLALLDQLGVAPLPPLDHGYLSSLSNETLECIRGPHRIDTGSIDALRKIVDKLPEFLLCYDRGIKRRVEAAEAILREHVPDDPRERALRTWRDELRVSGQVARPWSDSCAACSDEQRARARRYADDVDELAAMLDAYLEQGC